jgi:hypothetical protein
MTKIDQIWIRACKSYDPVTRLRSVYRRMYFKSDDLGENDKAILAILSSVADRHTKTNMSATISAMQEANARGTSLIVVPMHVIRFTKYKDFEGITWKKRSTHE